MLTILKYSFDSEVLFDNHVDNSEVLQAVRIMLKILKYSLTIMLIIR